MAQLILIPGLAADASLWQAQLAALPLRWSVQVSDVHTRHTTIEAMAQALLAEHEGPLVLCGASMGGIIAMQAVHQAPHRVVGLALLGTTARPETAEMRTLRQAAIALFEQNRVREVIEPNVALAFAPQQAARPELVQRYLDFVLRAGSQQLVTQNRAIMARRDARPHLTHITCPTLVVCGDSDQLTPPECSDEIAALIPGAQRLVVPQCGHMLTMEQPEWVNAALLAWLNSLKTYSTSKSSL
jgi:pimeloyl-ACP methyl ester carboxylesterase